MTSSSNSSNQQALTFGLLSLVGAASVVTGLASYYFVRKKRSESLQQQADENGEPKEALHSIIDHFHNLQLAPETTVEEANKRRTASYYLKSREAHARSWVRGVHSYRRLRFLRARELERTLSYDTEGTKSHRTVVTMCDSTTAHVLQEAREMVLRPLQYSSDPATRGVWIPELHMIPVSDMHVTVAIPWWWHTRREGNYELSKELASRFRQTLLLKLHHPFQVELQRIVLLGGRTLVALWKCVGERVTEEGHVVYDRHGETVDPFVRLRVEIVRCFTTESPDNRRQPLTYSDMIQQKQQQEGVSSNGDIPLTPPPKMSTTSKPELKRVHSIEARTPGMGQGDGFIHTTLCRLPLECLSQSDVGLDEVHRLCREASATLSGHRMVISKFRFLETTGRGGESNPCVDPIYDETIEAPCRFHVERHASRVQEMDNLHIPVDTTSNRTIGAIRNHVKHKSLDGLFDAKEVSEHEIQEEEQQGELETNVIEITAPMLI